METNILNRMIDDLRTYGSINFWPKVDVRSENECWNWKAGLNNKSYGAYNCYGTCHQAHRVAYVICVGEIPDDLKVLHKCDNPKCVNPKHLFLGTQAINVSDMNLKGRNGLTKLSEESVRKIWKLWHETDLNQHQIADEFKVGHENISRIILRQIWIQLDLPEYTTELPVKQIRRG